MSIQPCYLTDYVEYILLLFCANTSPTAIDTLSLHDALPILRTLRHQACEIRTGQLAGRESVEVRGSEEGLYGRRRRHERAVLSRLGARRHDPRGHEHRPYGDALRQPRSAVHSVLRQQPAHYT